MRDPADLQLVAMLSILPLNAANLSLMVVVKVMPTTLKLKKIANVDAAHRQEPHRVNLARRRIEVLPVVLVVVMSVVCPQKWVPAMITSSATLTMLQLAVVKCSTMVVARGMPITLRIWMNVRDNVFPMLPEVCILRYVLLHATCCLKDASEF